jgi:hypothetical protein
LEYAVEVACNNHREVGVFITTYWTRLRWYEKTGYGLAAIGVVLAALLLVQGPAVQAVAPLVTSFALALTVAFVAWARRRGLYSRRS